MTTEAKPLKVYLPRMVCGDCPIGHLLKAPAGVYNAVENKHGAVSVILPGGTLLGVKPEEFERVE
jgi:hypothetical protein